MVVDLKEGIRVRQHHREKTQTATRHNPIHTSRIFGVKFNI